MGPMALTPESFVSELDAQNQVALARIALAASSGEAGEAVTVPRLLLLALKNELEATECAAAWILTTPEVDVKLAYNDFPPSHHIITDYSKYLNVLEATYRGVEQRNDDARRLVRRRAAVAYTEQLHELCSAHSVKHSQAHDFARSHAVPLVMAVVAALLADFSAGSAAHVMQETAHLAVCLIVADAVIECEVLERPADAVAS